MTGQAGTGEWCCCEGVAGALVKDCGHTQGMEFVLLRCPACNRHWMSLYSVVSSSVSYVAVNDADAARLQQMPEGRDGRRLLECLFDL